MKKALLIFMLLLCLGGLYFFPHRDCTHPITKSCVVGEFRRARVHIAGKRYWHLPYFYCRTYIVNNNACYWRKYEQKKH